MPSGKIRGLFGNFYQHRGGHSASEEARFRHFQIVSETLFFVFSVILIHILILFWPIWFCISRYGPFMAIVIFQWPKIKQSWAQIWNNWKRKILGSQLQTLLFFCWKHSKLKIWGQKFQTSIEKSKFLSNFVLKNFQILSHFSGYRLDTAQYRG